MSRRPKDINNTVAILHGLASSFDPATTALLTPVEMEAALQAPDNYEKARDVLVAVKLLPAISGARPLKTVPALLDILVSDYIDRHKKWLGSEVPQALLDGLPDSYRQGAEMTAVAIGMNLTIRIVLEALGQGLAQEVSTSFEQVFAQSMKIGFEPFVGVVADAETLMIKRLGEGAVSPQVSPDMLVFDQLLDSGNSAPNSDEEWRAAQEHLARIARFLGLWRIDTLARTRFLIRYMSNEPSGDVPDDLVDLYTSRGAWAPEAERASYFEDWIGFETVQ